MENFVLYAEQWPAIALLDARQKAELLQAIFALHGACEMPELDVVTNVIFLMMKPRFNANKAKYQEVCEKRRASGAKGGIAKGENTLAKKQMLNSEKQNSLTVSESDSDTDFIKTDANASSATAPPIAAQAHSDPPLKIQGKKKTLSGKRAESFLRWWEAFGDKRGKAEAVDAWAEIPELTASLVEKIIAAAGRYAGERPTMLAQGRTPKMAQGWITGRRWEDETDDISGTSPLPPPDPVKDAAKAEAVQKAMQRVQNEAQRRAMEFLEKRKTA